MTFITQSICSESSAFIFYFFCRTKTEILLSSGSKRPSFQQKLDHSDEDVKLGVLAFHPQRVEQYEVMVE
jgi:hypothetical protein